MGWGAYVIEGASSLAPILRGSERPVSSISRSIGVLCSELYPLQSVDGRVTRGSWLQEALELCIIHAAPGRLGLCLVRDVIPLVGTRERPRNLERILFYTTDIVHKTT